MRWREGREGASNPLLSSRLQLKEALHLLRGVELVM